MRLMLLLAIALPLNAQPIRALIIDGMNNHDWKAATTFLKTTLERTGRFTVDVSTAPAQGENWRPNFDQISGGDQ